MLFDTHAHLDSPRFEGDPGGAIERARSVGVTRIITCGTDAQTSAACVSIAHEYTGVHAAAGIHPHEAHTICDASGTLDVHRSENFFRQMRAWAQAHAIVAVGEIGLDYHYDFSPRTAQRAVLAAQLALASELGLPVIMHNRESDRDLRNVLEQARSDLRGVLHCFMGGPELAGWALSRGFYLGIAGPITFKNVDDLVATAKEAPLDRLLIETDSPYMAPHPHRGTRNEPALVRYVAQRLANIRGMELEELAERTTANAKRLFGVP